MSLIAIDPGSEQSAIVWIAHNGLPKKFDKIPNEGVLAQISTAFSQTGWNHLAIEMIASYGMPVGAEVFETCVWIGQFIQAWGGPYTKVYRREVKMFLCGNNTAKDGNIRQALIDRYGGKDAAIGRKATPGPLYGISADVWSALAVAVTWQGTHGKRAA
jgi:hypothetical protein